MEDRKIDIMQAAMRFFSKKGFQSTSMQEIANEAGMSKGSLYKYFESKEELLIKVFKFNHDNMVGNAKYININDSLNPKEKFKKMLIVEFEGILENKEYYNLLTKSLLLEKNKQIRPLMQQVRAELTDWHKEVLLQVYGDDVEPIIWDTVITLQGIFKEYMSIVIQDTQKLSLSDIATYVVDSIDAIIQHQKHSKPLLKDEMMTNYKILKNNKKRLSVEEQLSQMLTHLRLTIETEEASLEIRKELENTISFFKQELKEKTPRIFLLNSLLANLENKTNKTEDLKTMKTLIDLLD
ncbi:TetR/AcrR family transcriptional regulator [Paraliobacillus zengyii]|uniref:TetR/AcrR family transcriptional regulator n=1 Tax=Paraliobacillus zengyii TaxID=2213194 RepID=UPI000E3ED1BC|nr:TetR/AcrR family transcriptional regulator [Paraliobacillus zengyii]